jgi:pantetheine-phosphate adenylyltransferase
MIAVYPGSFDPPTVGHLDIIRRSAALFEKVYVAVLVNPAKKPMFPIETRRDFLSRCAAALPNVEVLADNALLADVTRRLGADCVVKGLRSEADYAAERSAAAAMQAMFGLETLFLPSNPAIDYVSASIAREMMTFGRVPKGLVPDEILDDVMAAFRAIRLNDSQRG